MEPFHKGGGGGIQLGKMNDFVTGGFLQYGGIWLISKLL